MKWETLIEAYHTKNGRAVLYIALATILRNGTDKVKAMNNAEIVWDISSNFFDINKETTTLAAEMVKKIEGIGYENLDILFAFIQREIPPVTDETGENIPIINDGDVDGVCPVCGSELDYNGDMNHNYDDGSSVTWVCNCCGASGESVYSDVFDYHQDVMDKDNNPIEGRSHSRVARRSVLVP